MQTWWLRLILGVTYAHDAGIAERREPVILREAMFQEAVAAATCIWVDSSPYAAPEAALARLRSGAFEPMTEPPPAYTWRELSFAVTWVATVIENRTDAVYPLLVYSPGVLVRGQQAFMASAPHHPVPFSPYPHPDTTGYIHFPLRQEQVVTVSPCTRDTLLIPVCFYNVPSHYTTWLSDARTYESTRIRTSLGQALYFTICCGMMLMLVLYAIFNYIQLREGMFLWYMLYCVAILAVCWRNVEVHFPYAYLSYYHFRWLDTKTYLFAAMLLGYTQFVNSFLEGSVPVLRRMARWITYGVIVLVMLETLLLVTGADALSRLLYTLSTGLSGLVGLRVVWVLLGRQGRLGQYILIGTLCLLIGEVITWWFPQGLLSESGAVGVLLESACFTAGLAYRSSIWKTSLLQTSYENQELQLQRDLEAERTRTRIAQDVHDQMGSILIRVIMGLELAVRVPHQSLSDLKARIVLVLADARLATATLREVIHTIKQGADSWTHTQADIYTQAHEFWQDRPVELICDQVELSAQRLLDPEMVWHIRMISREAQTNIAKYAAATRVHLTFREVEPGQFLLEIRDNGQGFDPEALHDQTDGIKGMKWRADRIGAHITITSQPGVGTCVRVTGPVWRPTASPVL